MYRKECFDRMDIKMMEYVVEIERCGSINKAAKNLYLSQPNLSNALKNLESELGYTLFVRKNSGIQLTNAGRIFLSSAKIIVSEMQKIRQIPRMFTCLLYTSPSPRDRQKSRMPSSA